MTENEDQGVNRVDQSVETAAPAILTRDLSEESGAKDFALTLGIGILCILGVYGLGGSLPPRFMGVWLALHIVATGVCLVKVQPPRARKTLATNVIIIGVMIFLVFAYSQ